MYYAEPLNHNFQEVMIGFSNHLVKYASGVYTQENTACRYIILGHMLSKAKQTTWHSRAGGSEIWCEGMNCVPGPAGRGLQAHECTAPLIAIKVHK